MSKNSVKLAIFSAVLLTGGVLLGADAAMAYQGYMLAARGDLQQARTELNRALPDKAGHRVAAINLVNQALSETNAGLVAGAQ